MWLLKLHFAFSILCLITFFGVMMFSQDVLKRNGYMIEIKGKKNIRNYLRCIQIIYFSYPTNVCSYFKHIGRYHNISNDKNVKR